MLCCQLDTEIYPQMLQIEAKSYCIGPLKY